MTRPVFNLVSCSGGKDSTATLLLALKQFPTTTGVVFADTGNEHELTYEYLGYLEQMLGISITRLRRDFSGDFAHKRKVVATKWPADGVPQAQVDEALALLYSTGNPFLDLCMLEGAFPARLSAFCTKQLKIEPLTECALAIGGMLDSDVWSWQGVRRDESENRKHALDFEDLTGGLFAYRPIAGWTAQETVDFVTKVCGLKLNPLYALGMTRVGCMPCINANKAEIAEIARRFPEHMQRIAAWERLVAAVAKRHAATFFHTTRNVGGGVESVIRWAQTFRGGKTADPQWLEPAPACSSSYGLCE